MARLVKVADEKIIQEAVPAVPSSTKSKRKYIGNYDGFWDEKDLRKMMRSYNYVFASPPKRWYGQSWMYPPLTPDLVFDEYGNGTIIYWEGEKKIG